MSLQHHFDRLPSFLLNLECLDMAGKIDAFINEVIETGGSYVAPADNDTWASHLFEISLHSVSATGANEEEAIRNWIRAARCHLPDSEDDGLGTTRPPFPKPRNHVEDIANARAAAAGAG